LGTRFGLVEFGFEAAKAAQDPDAGGADLDVESPGDFAVVEVLDDPEADCLSVSGGNSAERRVEALGVEPCIGLFDGLPSCLSGWRRLDLESLSGPARGFAAPPEPFHLIARNSVEEVAGVASLGVIAIEVLEDDGERLGCEIRGDLVVAASLPEISEQIVDVSAIEDAECLRVVGCGCEEFRV